MKLNKVDSVFYGEKDRILERQGWDVVFHLISEWLDIFMTFLTY